jgi:hypothetical protein
LEKEKEKKEHKEHEREQEQARLEENRRKRDTHLDLEKLLSLGGDKVQSQATAVVSQEGQEGQAGANSARRIIHAKGAKRGTTTVAGTSTLTPLIEETSEENRVQINFKVKKRGIWRDIPPLLVDSSDPSEVERVAKKCMWKGLGFWTQINAC